jgi:hypothetical protein
MMYYFIDTKYDLLLDLVFVLFDIDGTSSIIQFYCGEYDVDYNIFGRFYMDGFEKQRFLSASICSQSIRFLGSQLYEINILLLKEDKMIRCSAFAPCKV